MSYRIKLAIVWFIGWELSSFIYRGADISRDCHVKTSLQHKYNIDFSKTSGKTFKCKIILPRSSLFTMRSETSRVNAEHAAMSKHQQRLESPNNRSFESTPKHIVQEDEEQSQLI